MNPQNDRNTQMKKVIDSFWRVIPPLWHYTRFNIHRMASEEYGITALQYHMMRKLDEGKKSISEISQCMFVSRPNISRTVDELVNNGLARRERDGQDRRVVYLSLTDKGKDLVSKMRLKSERFMSQMFSSLSGEELLTITAAFNNLEDILAERKG